MVIARNPSVKKNLRMHWGLRIEPPQTSSPPRGTVVEATFCVCG